MGNHGYGEIGIKEKRLTTHRASWITFRGDPGRLHVLHRCDVRACINPDHLFLGTIADNNADMKSKGRHNAGERHGLARLTKEKVLEIRALCDAGVRQPKIAEMFGVCQQTVSDLNRRKRWRHV